MTVRSPAARIRWCTSETFTVCSPCPGAVNWNDVPGRIDGVTEAMVTRPFSGSDWIGKASDSVVVGYVSKPNHTVPSSSTRQTAFGTTWRSEAITDDADARMRLQALSCVASSDASADRSEE